METAPAHPRAATPRRAWSMVRRMALFYTLSAAAILFAGIGFLYWVMAANLREEDNDQIGDEIETLVAILHEHPGDMAPLKTEVEVEGAARSHAKYYARIIEASGHILIEAADMKQTVPSPESFPAAAAPEFFDKGTLWHSPAGQGFLLASVRTNPTNGVAPQLIQVALEVTDEEKMLGRYRRWIALVLALAILGSAGAGVLIARRGLRPLEKITTAAQRVTATRLDARIVPERWPAELTTLATEFDKMLARLEESFTRLSRFSADLAHELRTPINNLMGESEVALARGRTPEEYRQVLESGLEEYGRLARMIDSLLFLARAENAETKLQRATFGAALEIHPVMEFFSALAEEHQIGLTSRGDASLQADAILFRRALSNLLSNALQYTPRGGRILISVQAGADSSVEVSVEDSGCGIAPEHLPKIFDRFYRIDPARSGYPQGTGLGLAIVKSIMELHGGSVTVRSGAGQGTTATLRFPALADDWKI